MASGNGAISTETFTIAKAKKLNAYFKSSKFIPIAFVYHNNPSAFIALLRAANLTSMVTPDAPTIDSIINRLLMKQDYTTIKSLMTKTIYNPQAKNFTTNPNTWIALQLNPGDFTGLYNRYVAQ